MQTVTISTPGAVLHGPLRAVAAQAFTEGKAPTPTIKRLDEGWEFRKGGLTDAARTWAPEDAAAWQAAALPHCFNALDACDPDTAYFRGQGWYRSRLTVRNPFTGGRTLLHFQGAGQTTSLWVGSQLVGTHKGGYDEFAFDITEALAKLPAAGRNAPVAVTVCCDNTHDPERVPSDLSDFCLYGGLYRHVNLVYLPALSLERVHILPKVADGGAQITVAARLYNPAGQASACELTVEVLDPSGNRIHHDSHAGKPWSDEQQIAAFHVEKPELWSPDSPRLYECRVTLAGVDGTTTMTERFGIRTAEFVEHGPFLLNGKRVLLRGTHRHADHAGVAAAMSDEQVREEMRLIKEMGANYIRLAHYQQDRLVLELCDELGIMVWEEAPWCRAGVGDEAFKQHARQMLTHMIDQHYNHPAIILWGLGNEDDWPGEYPSMDKEAIRGFMTEMRELAHKLDGSRLTSLRRCDFARDIPDVYSPSIWAGWYGGDYRQYEQRLTEQRERVKRFIHMEWGADSHAGRHSENSGAVPQLIPQNEGTEEHAPADVSTAGPAVSKDGDWSETYACRLFDWYLKTQEKIDWLTGAAQWAFKDFASPLRGENGIPRINQKGVVERDLRRKESYYVFQSYWAAKPMAHIYGHNWPVRWGGEGEERSVFVYSNCERAELFLNGKSQGERRRDSQDFPAAGLRWQVKFAAGANHLRVAAVRGHETVTDEIDLVYETRPWGKPAELRIAETAREGDRITVQVKLFDASGAPCLDAAEFLRFRLSGAGRLLDNLGTTRGSRELQLANGRAEISLVRTGACAVEAEIEGLKPAALQL